MPLIPVAAVRRTLLGGDADGGPHAKGRALEAAVTQIFGAIPGLGVTQRNVTNAAGSEEIDVVFFNDQLRDGLWFLEQIVIVECKNWSAHVTADEVSAFKTKLQHRKRKLGILVAANGITGNWRPPSSAYHAVEAALRDGIEILVFTRQEIESFVDTDELVSAIKGKIVDLTAFGTLKPR